uniref:Peptidase metallopeptidase domain-containing protein n=1 Tax=Plectus sambesii TaxID=2011161 RepID=A0A914VK11_9BILA
MKVDLKNGRYMMLGIALQFLATASAVYARPVSNANVFPSSLVDYMERYGYLSAGSGSESVRSRSSVESALRRLQRFNGLEVTGVIDEATNKLLAQKRCGVADFQTEEDLDMMKRRRRRSVSFRSLLRRSKRYVLHTKLWSSNEVSFRIGNTASSLPMSEVRPIILKALRAWEEVSGLRFVEKSPTESATIEISFQRRDHGDNQPFKGTEVLAHAFLPDDQSRHTGDIHFNDGLTWSKLSYFTPENDVRLLPIAIHEIGHSLGLQHSDVTDSIMRPTHDPEDSPHLTSDDIEAIQSSYGKPQANLQNVDSEESEEGEESEEQGDAIQNRYIKIYDEDKVYFHFQIKNKQSGYKVTLTHNDGEKTTITLARALNDWLLLFESTDDSHHTYHISRLSHGHTLRIQYEGETDTFVKIS